MLTWLLFSTILSSALLAQESGVPVIIDGKEVVRVYGAVGQFSPADRAPEITHRIEALAERGYAGEMTTRAIPSEKSIAVVAGASVVMAVTDLDAEAAGVAQDELARRYASSIQNAIGNYRVQHTFRSFLTSLIKTVLAWTLFAIVAWVLWKSIRWLSEFTTHWFGRLATARDARGVQLMIFHRSRVILITLVKSVIGLSLLSAFSFLISYTFGLFPQTAGISTTLLDHLRVVFGGVGLAIVNYLPSGGIVIVVIWISYQVLKILKFLTRAIEQGELPIKGIHPEMAQPTYQLVRLMVVLFALVVAFPYLPGGQSEAFKGVSIFLGLLLSLGSSSAVSNVLAGLVLTYMRAFRNGDRVKIADTVGDVLEKTLLVTRVQTIKNVEVVIPNSAILSNQILNYSALARTRGVILNTTVTIGYDAPWRTVHELLINAGLRTDGILPDPRPFVLQTSLNDFHISYELNVYTDQPNEIQNIYSHLHEAIQDSFNKAGVEIMSPTFYALRDGNTVTIPASNRPEGYETPSFHVKIKGNPQEDHFDPRVVPGAAVGGRS